MTGQWTETNLNDDTGYFLEVDLFHDPSLHRSHDDFPLAPERKSIPYEQFSPYLKHLLEHLGDGDEHRPSHTKLMCTLHNKNRYIIHSHTLKLYLDLGLKLTHVYRVLTYR